MQKLNSEENMALGAIVEYLQKLGFNQSISIITRELHDKNIRFDTQDYVSTARHLKQNKKTLQEEMVQAVICYPELQEQNAQLNGQLVHSQRKVEELKQAVSVLEKKKQHLTDQRDQSYQQAIDMQKTFLDNAQNLRDQYQKLHAQCKSMETERDQLQSQLEQAQTQLSDAKRVTQSQELVFQTRIDDLEGQCANLQNICIQNEQAAAKANDNADKQNAEIRALQQTNQALQEKLQASLQNTENLTMQLEQEQRAGVVRQQQFFAALQKETADMSAKHKQELQRIATEYNQQMEASNKKYNQYLAQLTDKLENIDSAFQESQKTIADLSHERDSLQVSLITTQQTLSQTQQQAAQDLQALRAQLQRQERLASEQVVTLQKQLEEQINVQRAVEQSLDQKTIEMAELKSKLALETQKREQTIATSGEAQIQAQRFQSEIQRLQGEVSRQQLEQQHLQSDLQATIAQKQRVDAELQGAIQQKQLLQNQLQRAQTELQQSQQELQNKQHQQELQVQAFKGQIQQIQTQADSQVSQAKSQQAQLQLQIQQLQQQLQLQQQQQSQQTFNTSLAAPYQSVSQQSLRQQLEEAEQEVQRLQSKNIEQKRRLVDQEERIAELEVVGAKAQSQVSALAQASQAELETKDKHYTNLLKTAELQIARATQEMFTLQEQNTLLQQQNAQLLQQVEKFRQEIAQTASVFSGQKQLILTDLDDSVESPESRGDRELLQTLRVQRKAMANQAKQKTAQAIQTDPDDTEARRIDALKAESQSQKALIEQMRATTKQLQSDIELKEEEKLQMSMERDRVGLQAEARIQRLVLETETLQSTLETYKADMAVQRDQVQRLQEEVRLAEAFQDEQQTYIKWYEEQQNKACASVGAEMLKFVSGLADEDITPPQTFQDLVELLQLLQTDAIPKVEASSRLSATLLTTINNISEILGAVSGQATCEEDALTEAAKALIEKTRVQSVELTSQAEEIVELKHLRSLDASTLIELRQNMSVLERELREANAALSKAETMRMQCLEMLTEVVTLHAGLAQTRERLEATQQKSEARLTLTEKALDTLGKQLELGRLKKENEVRLAGDEERKKEDTIQCLQDQLLHKDKKIEELETLCAETAAHIQQVETQLLQAQGDKDVIMELNEMNLQLQADKEQLHRVAQENMELCEALKLRLIEVEAAQAASIQDVQLKEYEEIIEKLRQQIVQLRSDSIAKEDQIERLEMIVQRQKRDFEREVAELSARRQRAQ